jgi:putative ABC transport system permease protein
VPGSSMSFNYLRSAWRNTTKNRLYSFINISGLSIGLACFFLILLYLNYELSYDKWDPSLKKVYRIGMKVENGIRLYTPSPLASALAANDPNIASATAIMPNGDYEALVAAGDKKFFQKNIVTSDSSFFKVFPYSFARGNIHTALNPPNAIAISEEVSHKLFGDTDPIGKSIKLFNAFEGVITGVFKTPASPSHLNPSMVVRDPYEKSNKWWQNFSFQTYIKVRNEVKDQHLENRINSLVNNERQLADRQNLEQEKKEGKENVYFVDAIARLHNFPKFGSSEFRSITILLSLAFLLLIAGAINFSNLSIAGSFRRAKEVGVRKVLGSSRWQLLWQFLSEIAIQCFVALVLSLAMVYLALPWFKNEFNISLSLLDNNNLGLILAEALGCLVFIILLSGLYPSIFLSRFNPTSVLKGSFSSGKKGMGFRNALIVVQFTLSAFFILGSLVIEKQMDFMQSKDKGFSAEQVVRITAGQKTRDDKFATTREMLLSVPGVESVSKTTSVPGDQFFDTTSSAYKLNGKEYRLNTQRVSTDYFKTLDIDLVAGRLFTETYNDQNTRSAIINETAAKLMGQDVVGKTITFPYCDSVPVQIVGIVKDINIQDFTNAVKPVIYSIGNNACTFMSGGAIIVKINPGNIPVSISGIESVWKRIEPEIPIRYSFLDQNFQNLFSSYLRIQKIVGLFTLVAIVIAVMGLFALTAFLTRQRLKEIGIRKVVGASVKDIIALMSRSFLRLVLIATLLAIPLGWLAASRWLDTFAYRANINWVQFILTIAIIFVIAFITITIQTLKAALANPVKSLRTE